LFGLLGIYITPGSCIRSSGLAGRTSWFLSYEKYEVTIENEVIAIFDYMEEYRSRAILLILDNMGAQLSVSYFQKGFANKNTLTSSIQGRIKMSC